MFILRGERGIRRAARGSRLGVCIWFRNWDRRDGGRPTVMEYERSVRIPVSMPLNAAEDSCLAADCGNT